MKTGDGGRKNTLIALAGQPNCGKSTVFNLLTGARQHVANYPGVTVEKKQGRYRYEGHKVEVIDLPGTYSMTSYTQEERVARDFVLLEKPDLIVAVVDAANLERHLYLVFQLLEMQRPLLLCVNMIDVAKRRSIGIDAEKLSKELGVEVLLINAKSGKGGSKLKSAIDMVVQKSDAVPEFDMDYGAEMNGAVDKIAGILKKNEHLVEDFPPRWLAVKILESDSEALRLLELHQDDSISTAVMAEADRLRTSLAKVKNKSPEKVIAVSRYKRSTEILSGCVTKPLIAGRTLTDKIDAIVLHRVFAPVFLAIVLYLFYQIAMGFGTVASDTLFPYIGQLKVWGGEIFHSTDPLRTGLLNSLIVDGLLGGIVAILYYVPLFFILFTLLAIMEDTGYMARVAFILDRILRFFGLHGQSVLPMILGGVVVGGCAVPGVMATRAMKDEKARLLTILIMPLMNCLAKIPFFVLMVGLMIPATAGYYIGGYQVVGYQGLTLFGLSVFSFILALLIAKLFSKTIIKGESAPFVMELPAYHMPTIGGVLKRAVERVLIFIKKIVTVVAVVQVGVWFFVTFPGIGFHNEMEFDQKLDEARVELVQQAGVAGTPYESVSDTQSLDAILEISKSLKTGEEIELNSSYSPDESRMMLLIANKGKGDDGKVDKYGKKFSKALKDYKKEITKLRVERKKMQINDSFAGIVGHALEPVSEIAGFNWRMNIAIIASFAAKESLVGTLGTLYSVEDDSAGGNRRGASDNLSASVAATESGWTVWHKLAIIIFIALFPPCLATIIVIKNETASWKYALFASTYPIVFGFILASLVFQLGTYFSA